VDGVASQADLARRWGLSRQRVHQLVREPAFPAPAGRVSGQPVWFAAEADEWREYRELFLAEAALSAA
jgi:predicted DNA-binding transcriptional regulator AlpA